MITLKTPLSQLTRVGKTTAKQLKKLGLKTVQDLICHYPFRYDDYSKILTIAELKAKKSGTIRAKINLVANHRSPRKRMIITEAIVSDQTDSLKVIWFNQPYLARIFKSGQKIYLAGRIDYDDHYGLQLLNPSYEITDKIPIHTGRLVPVYPTTARLSQKQIRFLIRQALSLSQEIEDWLPRQIRNQYNLTGISFALEQIHFPQNAKWLNRAGHRLKFDELFLIQGRNHLIRQENKNLKARAIKFKLRQTKDFVKNLPFKLTTGQRKTAWEIIQDINKDSPMNRLLQGDVGSGKTIPAVIAILNTLLDHYQSTYLAPTEILAEQHFKTISNLLKNFPFTIGLLTRENILLRETKSDENMKIKKSEILKKIIQGKINLVIGTHALIQKKVKFKKLALAVVDEQHRFGVAQRAALVKQSSMANGQIAPHLLSMTATPIPRSVALTLYGDLDLSIIDEMPPGRKKIITKIVKPNEVENVYRFVKSEIEKKRQIFVICPLIDPSDKLGIKSVKEEYIKLSEKIFPDFKLGFLHGKLKSDRKEKIMKDFAQNKISILISTTVVEVGIDIPNASIMIIQGAERFGLAQLYQLRGRIGRNQHQSYCFLFLGSGNDYAADRENSATEETGRARQRLKALLTAENGLELAEKDLEMRGPGQIFGSKQSGFLTDLKIAKLSDTETIKQTQQAANQIFNQDPTLNKYPLLKNKINELIQITHLE